MSDQSSIIICSTSRLARSLQHLQQQSFNGQSLTQWTPTSVYTLSQWLNEIIEAAILLGEINAASAPLAELSKTQENVLWEQSITNSLKGNAAEDLFDTSGLASAAIEANKLLIEWKIKLELDNATEETSQFIQWREHFRTLCKKSNCLESVRFTAWQISCLKKGAGSMANSMPTEIALVGFDRVPPQLKDIINTLKARGIVIKNYPNTLSAPSELVHIVLNDQDAECRAAVAWAQKKLQQNPKATLAIVVPELEKLRNKISYLLDDIFHPETANPVLAENTRCYDFTLGIPLTNVPIIQTAFNLLRLGWQKQKMPQSHFTQLLHSPYWSASNNEIDARAKLDARIRKDLPTTFHPFRLSSYINHVLEGEYALPIQTLADDLTLLFAKAKEHNKQRRPSHWVNTFKETLKATHWHGQRSLSSHEYQANESFERILNQFAGLDMLLGNINANEAIKRLTQLTQAQIFQPENKTRPSIQVMGMLEAVSEPLDGIWVMGMNDNIWPPVARPNALIPAELQRMAGTPNASSEVQNEFGQAIHARLSKSAQLVVFSSAEKDNERQLRASPFILDIPQISAEQLDTSTLAETLAQISNKNWQWLEDSQAPLINKNEQISGGTALLKAQAICPAWAFFQYRLGIRAIKEPTNGLDAMERGTLVHAVLAKFWHERNSEDLNQMSEDSLHLCLVEIADNVLNVFNDDNNHKFSAIFLNLETDRLAKLVCTWLCEIEKKRPQSFQVSACEEKHTINIQDVLITFIVDRIDTLEDGRLLIMDYKTGSQLDYKNWSQSKITEPQLPIYAAFVMQDADIAAVCYAKVRVADHTLIGVAAENGIAQKLIVFNEKNGRKIFNEASFPDRESIIQHWKTSISATVEALKAGNAANQYNDESQLIYCEVLPLLRLPERQLQFEHLQSENQLGDTLRMSVLSKTCNKS